LTGLGTDLEVEKVDEGAHWNRLRKVLIVRERGRSLLSLLHLLEPLHIFFSLSDLGLKLILACFHTGSDFVLKVDFGDQSLLKRLRCFLHLLVQPLDVLLGFNCGLLLFFRDNFLEWF
jgi:hypothetical protein